MELFNLELENDAAGVFAISLVENPAVGINFLYFNKDEKLQVFAVQSEEEHVAFGVIMLADTPIYRNDPTIGEHLVQFTKNTVKNIVKRYAQNKLNDSVTVGHESKANDVYLFESYIIDRVLGINPPTAFANIPDGSWIGKFQVDNPEVWAAIKEGTFKGFSIEGQFSYGANPTKMQNEEDKELHYFENFYINLIKLKK